MTHLPLMRSADRINVVGTSGSGKSTFAKELARRLELSYVEMDALFWKADWVGKEDAEFFAALTDSLSGDSWVLDGNYSRTNDIKWKRAQIVIWLDYSFLRTLARAIKRAFTRAITKEEFWPGTGNRESFRRSFFSKESVVLWTIQSYGSVRERYLTCMKDPRFKHIDFIQLRNPKEAKLLLSELRWRLVEIDSDSR